MYGAYRTDGRDQQRWSHDRHGNRSILRERHEIMADLVPRVAAGRSMLEIGCGAGTVLSEIGSLPEVACGRVGVDLLDDRLRIALASGESVVQADGRKLPFGDDQFDLVVAFTVFSSILDASLRHALAREISRVLARGGSILWYDMRYPSPNRSVRPMTARQVRKLFPSFDVRLQSITLIPQVARMLGPRDEALYGPLARIPFARSHLMGLLVPTAGASATSGVAA